MPAATDFRDVILHARRELAKLAADELETDDPAIDVRTPSRWVGSGADPTYLRQLQTPSRNHRTLNPDQRSDCAGIEFLHDVRAWSRGDGGAYARLARSAKDVTGGELLIPASYVPGYLAAIHAAAPTRLLASEHEITRGGEVHALREGDVVIADWTAAGMTKPITDAAITEVVSLVHKCAALSIVPDELNADSAGLALEIVGRGMGAAIGKQIDVALLDGDGIGKPTGVLRAAGVAHTPLNDSSAGSLYDSIVDAVGRVRARFREPTAVLLRPEVLARFARARTSGSGELLFPGGLAQHLDVPVVVDGNLPVAPGSPATSSIIVGAFARGLHTFSRNGLVIEASQHAGWPEDATYVRGYERIGAAVLDSDAFEVLDDVELA